MRRIFLYLCLILLLMAAQLHAAAAQEAELRPALLDPVDCKVQRLSVMSQRDEAFSEFRYNGGYLSGRGCQPVSIANAVIAAFGMEDRETAAGAVQETTRLLVMPNQQGKGRIELSRIAMLMDTQLRAGQAEEYPYMAKTIGTYAGRTAVFEDEIDTTILRQFIGETGGPFVLAARMTVHPDWTAMVELVGLLSELGMDDALVCLANVGTGTEESRTPLGLGENGHYLTLLLHVGTFMQEGRMYVLDSLPRALKGEESGYTHVLRRPYPFAKGYRDFNDGFAASRIRETVIKLARRDTAEWTGADTAQKAKLLSTLILYGPGVLTISAP